MSFFLSPSGWIFPLRRGSSSSVLILPGLLRSDRGGLSVSSPSGEREDACGLRRWCKFPALEFYSASFLHWIFLLSYPYFSLFSPLNFLTELSLFQPLFSTEFPHWAILILLLFISLMNIEINRSPMPSLLRIPWISRGWTPAVRSMNQGKLEVVKQKMARVNVDILGIRTKMDWNRWI